MEPTRLFFHVWSNGFPHFGKEGSLGWTPVALRGHCGRVELQRGASSIALGFNPTLSSCGLWRVYFYKMGVVSLLWGCLAQ